MKGDVQICFKITEFGKYNLILHISRFRFVFSFCLVLFFFDKNDQTFVLFQLRFMHK